MDYIVYNIMWIDNSIQEMFKFPKFFQIFFFQIFSKFPNIYFVFEPRGYIAIGAPPCSSLRSRHTTVMIMYVFCGDKSQ